jgi:hypothetical protein
LHTLLLSETQIKAFVMPMQNEYEPMRVLAIAFIELLPVKGRGAL